MVGAQVTPQPKTPAGQLAGGTQAKELIGAVIPNAEGFFSTAAMTEVVSAGTKLTLAAARSPQVAAKIVFKSETSMADEANGG